MTFKEVEDRIKEVASFNQVEVTLNDENVIGCFGKNQAAHTDGHIMLGEYDSPELMALCFAHEMCHEFQEIRPEYSKFSYEWDVWGKTFDELYDMFGIYPSKELADHALKCLKSYTKDEDFGHS